MRAERCLRVGRDKAALRGVLGVHVVDFTWFLPTRETRRQRLERTIVAELDRTIEFEADPQREIIAF